MVDSTGRELLAILCFVGTVLMGVGAMLAAYFESPEFILPLLLWAGSLGIAGWKLNEQLDNEKR